MLFQENETFWIWPSAVQNGSFHYSLRMVRYPQVWAKGSKKGVFNTGQMIFGLVRAYQHNKASHFLDAFSKACQWLCSVLEQDGSWKIGAYIPGYVPTYYTRVIWAILYANTILQSREITEKMEQALSYYKRKQTPQFSFKIGDSAVVPLLLHIPSDTLCGAY